MTQVVCDWPGHQQQQPAATKTSPHAEDAYEGYVGAGRRMGDTDRTGLTHGVKIGGVLKGYIVANTFDDGTLREVFLHGFGSLGSTLDGWTQSFAIMLSVSLQFGSELPMLARKFAHMRFEPNGDTDNPDLPWCASVPHYIFSWLVLHFGDDQLKADMLRINVEMQNT